MPQLRLGVSRIPGREDEVEDVARALADQLTNQRSGASVLKVFFLVDGTWTESTVPARNSLYAVSPFWMNRKVTLSAWGAVAL